MRKRIISILLALCLLLSGCQLAKPDAQEETRQDRLVGVFITTEYLDLFDMEAYLKDHPDLLTGGTVAADDTSSYSGRIYASYIEESSEDGTNVRYVFADLEGILVASYLVKSNSGSVETYWMSDVSEGICDVNLTHHSLDNGEEHSITGTIYLSPDFSDACFFFNPVYQTEAGDVYITAGQGMSFDSDSGINATHTLKGSATYTENGETRSFTSESKITMETASPAQTVVVIQMDENNQILQSRQYSISDMPKEITVSENTAYILLEEHTLQDIRRTLYQSEDGYLTYFSELDNGICIKNQTQLHWHE